MILGIDPGIRKLWYALINKDLSIKDAGILLLDEKQMTRIKQYERMGEIYDFFTKLMKKYPEIDTVCIEKYFFTQYNKSNAEFVYGIRWALLMLFFKKGIQIKEYTPIEIKKRISWNAKAWKETMQQMIQKLYNLQDMPKFHDAADALWLALLWARWV